MMENVNGKVINMVNKYEKKNLTAAEIDEGRGTQSGPSAYEQTRLVFTYSSL